MGKADTGNSIVEVRRLRKENGKLKAIVGSWECVNKAYQRACA